jgi:hypothetical protein
LVYLQLVGSGMSPPRTKQTANQHNQGVLIMSPRAQLSDLEAQVFVPVVALARQTGTAPIRYQPANDTVAVERMDLLARRRRRQNRRDLRS